MSSYTQERVWIIGASSGIGAALATELSNQGARLILSARSLDKLTALNKNLGERHEVQAFDVADDKALAAAVDLAFQQPVDRIVFLAAAYEPMWLKSLDLDATRAIVETNLLALLSFVKHSLPQLENQASGQIALCGSVAGYVGLPKGQPYSATKAATLSIAESLKLEAKPGIDVKLISPGFVKTPMTSKNDFTMPMVIEPEEAALAIAEGLQKKAFEIHFPKKFTLFLKFLRTSPYWLYFILVRKLLKA